MNLSLYLTIQALSIACLDTINDSEVFTKDF